MNRPVLLALILMLVLVAISLYDSGKDIMDQLYEQCISVERMWDITL